MDKVLILGLGNRLRGDDGAGPAVLAAWSLMDLPRHVDLLDGGTPGLETVLLLQGYKQVIIVDAADMGVAPGEWRRFTPDSAEIRGSEENLQGTLHNAGLAEALALASALDLLPPARIIYGIQPESLDWSQELTEPLTAALSEMIKTIAAEVS
ncbi:MAG: hydrogenase maturation protease [Chloroflexota bacterium]